MRSEVSVETLFIPSSSAKAGITFHSNFLHQKDFLVHFFTAGTDLWYFWFLQALIQF